MCGCDLVVRRPKCRGDNDLEQLILGVADSERIEIQIRHGIGARTDLLHQGYELWWNAAAYNRFSKPVRRRSGGLQESRSRRISERGETIFHGPNCSQSESFLIICGHVAIGPVLLLEPSISFLNSLHEVGRQRCGQNQTVPSAGCL